MDEESRPTCPRCGEQSAVSQMREAFAAQMDLVRRKASEAQPPPPSPPPGLTTSDASGADNEFMIVSAVMDTIFEMFKSALDVTVVQPAAGWWRSKGQEQARERRAKAIEGFQQILDRHPELYYCLRDDVVFTLGGRTCISSSEAGRLLLWGEEIRLMTKLNA
jgi:hypothetical protein